MKSLSILVFLVAGAIGWNVAGNLASPGKSADPSTAAPSRSPQRPARTARKFSGPDEAARQQMAAIRASRDPSVRMRATVDLALSISPADFAAWFDGEWFDIRGGAELTLFSKILRERWEKENPESLLAYAIGTKSGLADEMLGKWAQNDPQRVLDFFQSHPNDSIEIQALVSVAGKDPALALRRLQEMAAAGIVIDRNQSDDTEQLLRELAKKSPAALEAALDSLPAAMKARAEPLLIAAKMDMSFDEEFQKLKDRPDSMKLLTAILENGSRDSRTMAISDRLLADLTSLPASWRMTLSDNAHQLISAKNASEWVNADLEGAGFSAEQSNQIRTRALGSLFGQPEIAIKLLGEFDLDEGNRRNVIANVFGNLEDPGQAAALIAQLTTEGDREYAQTLVSRRGLKTEQRKIDTPDTWLSSAAAIDPKTGGLDYQFRSALQNWDSGKRADLVRQFQALPDESKRTIAEGLTRGGDSAYNPLQGESVRFLVSHPSTAPVVDGSKDPFADPFAGPISAENRTSTMAVNYVSTLAQSDPTAAGDWIGTLPSGQPKLWAQKNLHALWSQYDPQAADQWLATQPASDRTALKDIGKKP